MAEIVVNASGVDADSLNWLMKADDGHYFIEQQRNRAGSHTHDHPINEKLAAKIIEAARTNTRKAWEIMERYVADSI